MEITIAKTYKNELQKKISELLKEYEKATKLKAESIHIVRQGQFDALGNETDFNYAVELKSYL